MAKESSSLVLVSHMARKVLFRKHFYWVAVANHGQKANLREIPEMILAISGMERSDGQHGLSPLDVP